MTTPMKHDRAGTVARCRRIRKDLNRVQRDVAGLMRGPLRQHVSRLLRKAGHPVILGDGLFWPTLEAIAEVAATLEQEAATL